jgi:hypothetical protein
MSLHSSMSPSAMLKRSLRDQSTGAPLTLRQQLNSAYNCQSMKARGYAGSRNPKDIAARKVAVAYMADIAEQLTLLDACEMGYIQPVIGGAMELNRGTE